MKGMNPKLGQGQLVSVSPRCSCRPLTVGCPFSVNVTVIVQRIVTSCPSSLWYSGSKYLGSTYRFAGWCAVQEQLVGTWYVHKVDGRGGVAGGCVTASNVYTAESCLLAKATR